MNIERGSTLKSLLGIELSCVFSKHTAPFAYKRRDERILTILARDIKYQAETDRNILSA